MENEFNFTYPQLFKEWMQAPYYRQLLNNLDLISVGLEGFEMLMQIKGLYPHLRVGYIYYHSLDTLSDWHGNSVLLHFTFIPMMTDGIAIFQNTSYRLLSVDVNTVHQCLSCLSKDVVIFGAMHDPTIVRLLDFYAFNQKQLILRRPMYFESSRQRPYIDKYLKFTSVGAHINIIDTVKVNRYLGRLGIFVTMPILHEEVQALFLQHVLRRLQLPILEDLQEPRLRLDSCLFTND